MMGRVGLLLAYLLATALAQCAHQHGPAEINSATRCQASCNDSAVHVSGHTSVDLDAHSHDCPACAFRSGHHAGCDLNGSPFRLAALGPVAELGRILRVNQATPGPDCRAPPLA
jgi:hypothetical protein